MMKTMWLMVMFVDTDWKAELFKRLDALSEKLGVAASHLWQILVRQGMAEAMGDLSLVLLAGIGLIACTKTLLWARKYGTENVDREGEWPVQAIVGFVVSGITGIIAIIAIFINTHTFVLWAVNPEYFALEKVLSLIGK